MQRPSLLSLALLALLVLLCVDAQMFQHFFNGGGGGSMFGGGREQEPPPAGDAKWFEARVDAAHCTQYLCPRTLSCVAKPSHCPCPFPQQIRCAYKDTDSQVEEISKKAKGSFGGVEPALDLGGSICVTAENCDQVKAMLSGKSTKA